MGNLPRKCAKQPLLQKWEALADPNRAWGIKPLDRRGLLPIRCDSLLALGCSRNLARLQGHPAQSG